MSLNENTAPEKQINLDGRVRVNAAKHLVKSPIISFHLSNRFIQEYFLWTNEEVIILKKVRLVEVEAEKWMKLKENRREEEKSI